MLAGLLPFALLDAASTDPHTHEDCLRYYGGTRQSSAVLGVKPAIEDVDASRFLAFRFA
jgi:hypothetical protein